MKQTQATPSEERIASATYILGFFQEIQALTTQYSQYLNLILELKNKYPKADQIEEQDRALLNQVMQQTRYFAHTVYIKYQTIIVLLKEKPDQDLLDAYKSIKENYNIDSEKLETYVLRLNAVLAQTLIKNLLESSQDIVNQLYGQNG